MKEQDDGEQGDYEVGYGKPPPNSRFKKGVSGNPKGRPKGARNFRTELNEELQSKITIQENGKRKRITKRRAAVKQIANKAAAGDLKAINVVFNQDSDCLPQEKRMAAIFDTPDDTAVLAEFIARLKSHSAADPDKSED